MLRTKGRRKRTVDTKSQFRVNQRIRALQVRVIDDEGNQVGVMDRNDAIALAEEKELDLVEVFPKAEPPVCKILDYGQFQYQQARKAQAQKAHVKKAELKGVRISFKIGQHDLDMRRNQTLKFLNKGDKVKIELILRGREKKYTKEAVDKVKEFIRNIKEEKEVIIEAEPSRQANQISAIIATAKN